jgi:polysaccharide export outer membrane protein
MKKKLLHGPLAALLVMILVFSGCVGKRNINYLQNKALSEGTSTLFENRKFEYRLQINDVLSIRVMGLDQETTGFFNVDGSDGVGAMSEVGLYVNGYSVDNNGDVQMPTVGKINVRGLTVEEAQQRIQQKINNFFTNATVILKLVSFKVSVIGAVERAGSYFVYNNQINLLEALALSGGVSEFADKSMITLLRQSDRGTQVVRLDLSDTETLTSEYYYLLPNDVIYVPALKARVGRLNLEVLAVLFAGISAVALIATVIQNSNP